MSIKSTQHITRSHVIDRIMEIYALLTTKRYKSLEEKSFEPYVGVKTFTEEFTPLDLSNIEEWTDGMLGDQMDEPFFRHSMFNNYLVESTT